MCLLPAPRGGQRTGNRHGVGGPYAESKSQATGRDGDVPGRKGERGPREKAL